MPIKKETKSKTNAGGKYRNGIIASPTIFAIPEATLALDIANPPPKRNIKPQGILFSIKLHVIKPSEGLVGLTLATKKYER